MKIDFIEHNGKKIFNIDTVEDKQYLLELGINIAEVEKTEKLKKAKQRIIQDFEAKMSALINGYPTAERDTWDIQQYEAMTYLKSKDEADAPLLSEVLKGEPEGVTLEELCNRVLAKAVPFKKMAGQYLAEKNKALRELEA